ncbi:DNA topoisomerase 3-alpha [Bienertia sinuspersici]
MATSHESSGNSSRSRSMSDQQCQVMCYHGEIAPLREVKYNGPTYGKKFYGCSYWPRTCGYFKWADEVHEIRDMQMRLLEKDTEIAELEMEKGFLEDKIKRLKEAKLKLDDVVEELSIENSEIREGLYAAKADKRVILGLALSWIFFLLYVLIK